MKSELLVICFHLLGFIVLMHGLFPFSSSVNKIANRSCFDSQESSKRHVMLMIIDALRADYVFNRNHSYYLKSIEKLEENGKCLSYKLRSHSPTITLPRLKALLTGTIPSFRDAIFNYGSSLDQIGPASGAFNDFVKDKLLEYDEIKNNIFSKMTENDMLIITSGYGGSSHVETFVPACFISQKCQNKILNIEEYLRIDLTPTLSALLQISISSNNLGIIIENLLQNFYNKNK
ncbi:unnamed protein product [Rotaria magnacalcarata]|nr:unnamed protein product [Rotaria magnacalcarata]CAF3846285.1 unnamed protein product [Rotaria magnacalcarata]